MNGGYFMVDCTGLNLLAESTQTISGIYAKSKTALESGKPIIANNCIYGTGVKMSPIPVFAIEEGDYIILTASILQIKVKNDNTITIINLAPANNTKTSTKKG